MRWRKEHVWPFTMTATIKGKEYKLNVQVDGHPGDGSVLITEIERPCGCLLDSIATETLLGSLPPKEQDDLWMSVIGQALKEYEERESVAADMAYDAIRDKMRERGLQ